MVAQIVERCLYIQKWAFREQDLSTLDVGRGVQTKTFGVGEVLGFDGRCVLLLFWVVVGGGGGGEFNGTEGLYS